MPIDRTHLLQVRVSEEAKRRIKVLAASQGMTLQEAVTEAFAAWEKALKAHQPKRGGKKGVK